MRRFPRHQSAITRLWKEFLGVMESAVRLDERITQLQLCADITADHDFPTAHQKIVKLLEEARKEREAQRG